MVGRGEPCLKFQHVGMVEGVHHLHLGRDLGAVPLFDPADGDELDRAPQPSLVDGGEAAAPYLLVELVLLHRSWTSRLWAAPPALQNLFSGGNAGLRLFKESSRVVRLYGKPNTRTITPCLAKYPRATVQYSNE